MEGFVILAGSIVAHRARLAELNDEEAHRRVRRVIDALLSYEPA